MPELSDGPDARHEATAFFIVAAIWLPLMAIAVGALVLPPGVAFSLVTRGLDEGHASWVALGACVGACWMVGLGYAARKLLRGGERPARSA